jgi:hypothetical protein
MMRPNVRALTATMLIAAAIGGPAPAASFLAGRHQFCKEAVSVTHAFFSVIEGEESSGHD